MKSRTVKIPNSFSYLDEFDSFMEGRHNMKRLKPEPDLKNTVYKSDAEKSDDDIVHKKESSSFQYTNGNISYSKSHSHTHRKYPNTKRKSVNSNNHTNITTAQNILSILCIISIYKMFEQFFISLFNFLNFASKINI